MLIGGAVLAVVLVVLVTASRSGGDAFSLVPPQSGPLGAVPPRLEQITVRRPAAKPAASAPRADETKEPAAPAPAAVLQKLSPGQLDAALLALLRAGRRVDAIKVHREQTGSPLRDAKAYVD